MNKYHDTIRVIPVALLAEGVDRNAWKNSSASSCRVALLAEGVDRNLEEGEAEGVRGESPSSRRAWIEMSK